MRIRLRARRAHRARCGREARVDAGATEAAQFRIVVVSDDLRSERLRMFQPFGAGMADHAFGANVRNDVFPLPGRAGAHHLVELLRQFRRWQFGVAPLVHADRLDEGLELLVVRHVHEPAPVLARQLPAPVEFGFGHGFAVDQQAACADHAESRIEQRNLHALAEAGTRPRIERHGDGDRAQEGRVGRAVGNDGIDGPAFGRMTGAIGAGGRAHHALPCLDLSTRIVRAETRQRAKNEARIEVRHGRGPESEAVYHPGTEVLDHHVGTRDQLPRRFPVCVRFEIERYAPLVAVPGGIGRRIPAWPARRVDAYDVRTLVAQQHSRHGPCDVLAEIDDANAFENTWHVTSFPIRVMRYG